MRVLLQRDCVLSVLVISIGILFLIQQESGLLHVDLEVQEPKDGKILQEQRSKEKSNNTVGGLHRKHSGCISGCIYL